MVEGILGGLEGITGFPSGGTLQQELDFGVTVGVVGSESIGGIAPQPSPTPHSHPKQQPAEQVCRYIGSGVLASYPCIAPSAPSYCFTQGQPEGCGKPAPTLAPPRPRPQPAPLSQQPIYYGGPALQQYNPELHSQVKTEERTALQRIVQIAHQAKTAIDLGRCLFEAWPASGECVIVAMVKAGIRAEVVALARAILDEFGFGTPPPGDPPLPVNARFGKPCGQCESGIEESQIEGEEEL